MNYEITYELAGLINRRRFDSLEDAKSDALRICMVRKIKVTVSSVLGQFVPECTWNQVWVEQTSTNETEGK